jgi:NAD(P)-dependent dehydrogenase (short-subunit alcohol dehydrogenase family)
MAGLIVVGTGPGISTSVARRFGLAGMPVGLIARSPGSVAAARAALAEAGVRSVAVTTADAAQEDDLRRGLDELVARHGVPDVLVYNAGLIQADAPGELSHQRHQAAYAINVLGALTASTHLAPRMADAGAGTIILTGGMPQPVPAYVSLSVGKAALRTVASILAQEYGPRGVHIATVTVGGAVEPDGPFDPDRIAERYWQLHQQPPGAWERESVFAGETAPAHG